MLVHRGQGIYATDCQPRVVIALGTLAGMAPDSLRVVHRVLPKQPLTTLQRFHRWAHTKRRLSSPLGISSQALFAASISWIVLTAG